MLNCAVLLCVLDLIIYLLKDVYAGLLLNFSVENSMKVYLDSLLYRRKEAFYHAFPLNMFYLNYYFGKNHHLLQSISIRDNTSASIYFIQLICYILVIKYLSSALEKGRERIGKHEKRFLFLRYIFIGQIHRARCKIKFGCESVSLHTYLLFYYEKD